MTQANELKYEKLKTDYFKALNVLKKLIKLILNIERIN